MAPSNPKYQAQITEIRRLRQDRKAGSGDGRGKMVRRSGSAAAGGAARGREVFVFACNVGGAAVCGLTVLLNCMHAVVHGLRHLVYIQQRGAVGDSEALQGFPEISL